MDSVKYQYKIEYDQRIVLALDDLPEHWSHQEHVFDTLVEAQAHLDNLHAYIKQQAHWYDRQGVALVRNISPILRREVTCSSWAAAE